MLDSLVNELSSEGLYLDAINAPQTLNKLPQQRRLINHRGPIIADVTDEMNELSTNNLQVPRLYPSSPLKTIKRELYSTAPNSGPGFGRNRKIIAPVERNYPPTQQSNRRYYQVFVFRFKQIFFLDCFSTSRISTSTTSTYCS